MVCDLHHRALLILGVTVAFGCAREDEGARQQRQLVECRTARPAYGNSLSACLVLRHHWDPEEANVEQLVQDSRELVR